MHGGRAKQEVCNHTFEPVFIDLGSDFPVAALAGLTPRCQTGLLHPYLTGQAALPAVTDAAGDLPTAAQLLVELTITFPFLP